MINITKINIVFILIIFFVLNISCVMFCAGQSSPLATQATQYSQDKYSVTIGTATERIVGINKVIIPEKDFYFPGESVSVFVEIKFNKYSTAPWELEHFTISELIDENLGTDKKSVRWDIIHDISEISNYKTSKFQRQPGESKNVTWTNNNFNINIPNAIISTKGVVYWYNITLEKTGTFNTETTIGFGQNTDYFHPETSLRINVINYSFFSPIWKFSKEIIWALIAFSGIFTFYNMMVSRRRRRIYPDEFLRMMIKDLKRLLTKISPIQFGWISLILFFILLYSYLSSHSPHNYKPISLLIAIYWDYITGIGPIVVLLCIILIMNKRIFPNPIKQTIKWLTIDMPPLVAFVLFMILYALPLILVLIMP